MPGTEPIAPHDTRHLIASKWTAVVVRERERHWRVVDLDREGLATLEAVLTGRRTCVPWRELRLRDRWRPGWVRAPRAVGVGAGLAGVTCARTLLDLGWSVTVLDKGRGAGGRASTRRSAQGRFDHGAPGLTPRGEAFTAWVQSRAARGLLEPWSPRRVDLIPGAPPTLTERQMVFVGVPGMSALLRAEAEAAGVTFDQRATALRRTDAGWQVHLADRDPVGPFEVAVVATPAPQAVPLLADAPALASQVGSIEVAPCWALLVAFERPLELGWDAARVTSGPLSWVAHEGSKPGRDGAPTYVAHATPAWSRAHLEDDPSAVRRALLDALAEAVGTPLPTPTWATAHRWRFARTERPLTTDCLWDAELRVGYCGDGCLGTDLEQAHASGAALAARVGSPVEAA